MVDDDMRDAAWPAFRAAGLRAKEDMLLLDLKGISMPAGKLNILPGTIERARVQKPYLFAQKTASQMSKSEREAFLANARRNS